MRTIVETNGFAKPCRLLRSLGRCEREHPCSFPLGLSGCFERYDEEVREGRTKGERLTAMLDLVLELHEEKNAQGQRVSVFALRHW